MNPTRRQTLAGIAALPLVAATGAGASAPSTGIDATARSINVFSAYAVNNSRDRNRKLTGFLLIDKNVDLIL